MTGDLAAGPGGPGRPDLSDLADRTAPPAARLEVLTTGPLALVQDLGRPGFAALGVGRSGAADRGSLSLANRLLGQQPGCAALEVTLGGLAVRAVGGLLVVVTGAPAPTSVEGRPVGHAAPFHLPDGAVLRLGPPPAGLRSYLGVQGGLAVDPVLGSRSTDTLSGIGPARLVAGMVLPVGVASGRPTVDLAPVAAPVAGDLVLRAMPGPRHDWLADLTALTATDWVVSARSDRVGLRLEGPPLHRHPSVTGRELTSEGVVRGGIQVPAGGQPVIFLSDHPVTGGYPVVAVLLEADADRAGQARPGQRIVLRLVESGGGPAARLAP